MSKKNKDVTQLSIFFQNVRPFHLLWHPLSHVFERFVWTLCVFFSSDTMNWSYVRSTNHTSVLCLQLSLCIISAASNLSTKLLFKYHQFLQTGTSLINFATWKTVKCPNNQLMCYYATAVHLNSPSIFLFHYFFTCSNWICFSTFNHNLLKSPSCKAKSFPQEWRKYLVYYSLLLAWLTYSLCHPQHCESPVYNYHNQPLKYWTDKHKITFPPQSEESDLTHFLSFLFLFVVLSFCLSPLLLITIHFSLCAAGCPPSLPPSHQSHSSLLPTTYFHVQEGIPTLASLQWMRSGIT